MRFHYDPHDYTTGIGFLKLLFMYKNTVLPGVLRSGLFWLSITAHIGFQLLARWLAANSLVLGDYAPGGIDGGADGAGAAAVDDITRVRRRLSDEPNFDMTAYVLNAGSRGPASLPEVDWRVASVTLSLLVFFLVFYTITEHGRYNAFFMHTVGIGGSVQEWAALVKLHIASGEPATNLLVVDADAQPPSAAKGTMPHRHWNAVRLVLASMQIMYYSIHGTGVDDQEWSAMISRGLLGVDEARTLQSYPGNQPWLCLCWSLSEVQAQIGASADGDRADSLAFSLPKEKLLERFRKLAQQMRWHYGQIINGRRLTVPFPYFHLLQMLIIFNLLMISYASVPLAAWPLTLLANVFTTVTVLGMRTVAIFLSDPFGDDAIDFDLEASMKTAYEEAIAQLRLASYVPKIDKLPAASASGEPIVDPTELRSGERSTWLVAGKTTVIHGAHGISKLSKSLTRASLFNSDVHRKRTSVGQLLGTQRAMSRLQGLRSTRAPPMASPQRVAAAAAP